MKTQYLSLECLSGTLGLPSKYLRELADEGGIPCLSVSGRLRFDEGDVRRALSVISHRGSVSKNKPPMYTVKELEDNFDFACHKIGIDSTTAKGLRRLIDQQKKAEK